MNKLIWRLVFPLTFISYLLFDKWWYVDVIDGPDEIVHGFPLISNSPSLATSLEINFYIFETITNLAIYFLFWFLVLTVVNRFNIPITIPKFVTKILYALLGIFLVAFTYVCLSFGIKGSFYFKRDIHVKILETGYVWSWKKTAQPSYEKYHSKTTNQHQQNESSNFATNISGHFILKGSNNAGFDFINSSIVLWTNEIAPTQPDTLKIRWLDKTIFVTRTTKRINESCSPIVSIYQVISFDGKHLIVKDIWTGWNDFDDETQEFIKQ